MWLRALALAAPFGTVTFRNESMADFSAGLEPSREGERPDAQQQVFWPCGHENLPKTPNSITMRFLLRVFYPWDTRTSPKKGIFGRVLPPGKQHTSFDRSAGGGTGVPLGPKWQSFLLPASQKDFANGCHLASPQSGFGQFWRQVVGSGGVWHQPRCR